MGSAKQFSRKRFIKYLSMSPLGALSIPEFLRTDDSEKVKVKESDKTTYERARLHPIKLDKPAVDFFEGALLGNGGMGVVVTTCPDAVALRFGHN